MSSKKAQGISINTIIIAAIALIVLVVLVMIFTGRMGIFTKGVQTTGDITKTCTELGGTIVTGDQTTSPTCTGDKTAIISKDTTGVSNKICCK